MLPLRVPTVMAWLLVLPLGCNARRAAPPIEESVQLGGAQPLGGKAAQNGGTKAEKKQASLPDVELPVTANVSALPVAALSLATQLNKAPHGKDRVAPISFNLSVNRPISLNLALPGGESWRTANVGTLIARLPGGKVRTLPVAADGSVTFKGEQPGAAMLVGCVGPTSAKGRSDAWQRVTHCTKTILRIGEPKANSPELDAGITRKVGVAVELVPFTSPLALHLGEMLTVKLHSNMGARSGTEVVAIKPDGGVERRMSSRNATAQFKIDQAGRWLLRFVDTESEFKRTAELVFEMPAERAAGPISPISPASHIGTVKGGVK